MSLAYPDSPELPQHSKKYASPSPPATPPRRCSSLHFTSPSSLFSPPASVSSTSSIGTDSERPYAYPILDPACFGEESLAQSSAMNAASTKRTGKRKEACEGAEEATGWSVRSQEADYEPLLQCVGRQLTLDLADTDAPSPPCSDTRNRFVLYPIKYPEIWSFYKKAQASFWTAEEMCVQLVLVLHVPC